MKGEEDSTKSISDMNIKILEDYDKESKQALGAENKFIIKLQKQDQTPQKPVRNSTRQNPILNKDLQESIEFKADKDSRPNNRTQLILSDIPSNSVAKDTNSKTETFKASMTSQNLRLRSLQTRTSTNAQNGSLKGKIPNLVQLKSKIDKPTNILK